MLDVDGAEAGGAAADEIALVFGGKAGAVFAEGETHDTVSAKVTGDGCAAKSFGEVRAVQNLEAGELGIVAGTDAIHDAARASVGEMHRAGDGVADALVARTIGDERVAEVVEVVAPRIAPAAIGDAGAEGVGAEMPNAAALEAHDAVRGFDVAANVNGLIKIKAAVVAPAEGVQCVMGVLGAEAGKDDALFVGAPIAVGVGEVEELSALGDIRATVARLDAGGDEKAIGEDSGFVRATIAGGVLEHDNFVIGDLAGLHLRIDG